MRAAAPSPTRHNTTNQYGEVCSYPVSLGTAPPDTAKTATAAPAEAGWQLTGSGASSPTDAQRLIAPEPSQDALCKVLRGKPL
eukprot:CAMPEP_0172904616 /NCGR_PEP_ID=MMETSP1075-20121228/172996_1 /TAXON_ID=2916 /ORGANISM="Ceratium fusus, Strain PA161109" /LENGTH=82 /DNA_ID=CAMNT_0013761689 /DNA_START=18 /DNA_END=266 /DNA_ORIENTATION=-